MTCPGTTTWIIPAHWHNNLELLSSAGMLETNTVGAPGTQGAVVTGIHGWGDIAAATAGFAIEVHIPKGAIFTMGLLSIMVAMGCDVVITILSGKTVNVPGATPKLHCSVAPLHTANAIVQFLLPPAARDLFEKRSLDPQKLLFVFAFCFGTDYLYLVRPGIDQTQRTDDDIPTPILKPFSHRGKR